MLAHAGPDRRSGGLHAAVRPRPRGRARPRRGGGGADHLPLPVRPGAAWSRATRCASSSTAAARAPGIGPQAPPPAARCRARPRHAPLPAGRRARPTSSTTSGCRSRPLDRRLLRPSAPARLHDALAPARGRIAHRRAALTKLLAGMDAVVVHSEHGAGRLQADFGVPAERLRVIPHGAFDYLTRQQDEVPLPGGAAAVEAPGDPRLRPDPAVQGDRRPARGLLASRGRRALDRRHAADADGRAPRAGGSGARAGSASSTASSPTRRSRPSCAAPTSSSCRTGTSSSPGFSTRRSPSDGRWC